MSNLPIIQQSLVETPAPQPVLNQAQTVPLTPQPSPEPAPLRKTEIKVTLFDGTVATVHRAKGKTMQNALRISSDNTEQGMIMAANVTVIDGNSLTYEDFLELDMADCNAILTAFTELMGN